MKKIAIAYRIYPGVSKTPAIFPDNKFKLSELCISSLSESLKNIDYKIWVILDKCPPEYKELFKKYFNNNIEFIDTNAIGNSLTFKMQLEILLKQEFSENVYFAEDDYFYLPNCMEQLLNFIESEHKPDFVTPYDHLDYYTMDFHKHKKETIEYNGYSWRTENSTCMTFLTTKEILRKTQDIFLTYAKKNYDASLWLAITKIKALNLINYFKFSMQNISWLKTYAKLWIHTPYFIFKPKYKLYTPIPSLSTHLEAQFLAPNINWKKIFEDKAKNIFI